MKKKVLAAGLVLAMTATLLAGCSSGSSESSGGSAESDSGSTVADQNDTSLTESAENNGYVRESITLAYPSATSLTPWGTSNATPGAPEVYESLYEVDAEGNLFPVLADETRGEYQGYDHEEGTTEYTFYIYDYIYDHNGNHITADDVAFSFNHQHESEATTGWDDFIEAEAVDDTTILFKFEEEQNELGQFAGVFARCYVVSEDSYNNSSSQLASEMIGTGPYKMDNYVSGSALTLVKNDDYWQTDEEHIKQAQRANVNKIEYQFIDESSTRLISLKSDEVDMTDDVATSDTTEFLDGAEYGDKYNVFSYMTKEINSLWLNCSDQSICGDVNMRKAIYYAIDLDGLVSVKGDGDERAIAFATSYYSDYYGDAWALLDNYNTYAGDQTERAEIVQQYLDAAGYNGEEVLFMYQSDQDVVAQIIINMLSTYGINVQASGTDHAGSSSKEPDPTAWDMEMGKWAGDYNAQAWDHAYSWEMTAEGDHTVNFVYDADWNGLLKLLQTEDGHTEENLTEWLNMMYDNAYGFNLYAESKNVIYPADMTYLYRDDKLHILPGACIYTEQ